MYYVHNIVVLLCNLQVIVKAEKLYLKKSIFYKLLTQKREKEREKVGFTTSHAKSGIIQRNKFEIEKFSNFYKNYIYPCFTFKRFRSFEADTNLGN